MILSLRKEPSSDNQVFKQIFGEKEYAPLLRIIASNKFLKSDVKFIIDAGANIGCTSVYFSKVFPNSSIISIEPDQDNFSQLKLNLSHNNIDTSKAVQGGIWNKDCFLKIIKDFRDKSDWAIRVEETSEETQLRAYSISTIMETFNMNYIDILKIDVEGAEKNIFNDDVSNFLPKTKFIAIEIHDEFNCREQIYGQLENFGFEFETIAETTFGFNKTLI